MNILFFLSMITDFWLRSDRLFVSSACHPPGMYTAALCSFSHTVSPYIIRFFSDIWLKITSRYVKSSSSFRLMTVSRLSLFRICSLAHSFRISLSALNIYLYEFSRYFYTSISFLRFHDIRKFSPYMHDTVFSCLLPRYTLRNHRSVDILGNLSGILSRFFHFFFPCKHEARFSFLLPTLFGTSRYRSASASCLFHNL